MTKLFQQSDFDELVELALLLSGYKWASVSFILDNVGGSERWCSSPRQSVAAAFDALEACAGEHGCVFDDVAAAGLARQPTLAAQGAALRAYAAARHAFALTDGRAASCLIAVGDPASQPAQPRVRLGLAALAKQAAGRALAVAERRLCEQRCRQGATGQPEFRLIFESLPGCYLVLTPERFEIVAASNAYLAAATAARDAIVGRELFDVFPNDPDDTGSDTIGALRRSLNRVRETGMPDVMAVQRYPLPRPAREGGGFMLKYWSPVNSPVLNPDGSMAFIVHRVEDVTEFVLAPDKGADALSGERTDIVLRSRELKRLANSLAESERRFGYVTRATNDVVWDWDLASDSLWCSHSAHGPLGEQLATLASLGQWIDRIDDADRARVVASLRACVAARTENWTAEYRLSGAGGAVLDVLHRSFLVLGDDHEPQRMVGSVTDLSECKRHESKVREQAELLDYATDAILVRDLDNRVMYWNRAAVARYGWRPEEMIGRPVSETLYATCPPAEFAHAMEALMRFGDYSGRMVHSARDGRRFVVHAHWILVRHEDGSPRAILSVVTDLSDRIALEQRLAQMQKLESLGRLTGGIAHDFNNWLTVILGSAEELVEALEFEPHLRELASMNQMAATRAAELTRRLLAFARRQPLAPEVINVGKVVQAMRPLVVRSLGANIAMELILPQHEWPVFVDPAQLEASILNLCINARDAMPEGGRLTIEVMNVDAESADSGGGDPLAPGEYVVVAVSDNGHGIAHEVLDHVFEPFVTTKSATRGSGLGLSMVYGFVKQSSGNVTIQSEPGRGTTVKLYLPRSYQEAPESDRSTLAPAPAAAGHAILLVEDDAIVREHTQCQLQELGYHVTPAGSAAEALALLDGGRPFDVLFSDIVMPGASGIELAEAAMRMRPALRVLLSSGYTYEAMQHRDKFESDFAMLHKPYGKATLARALAELIHADGSQPVADAGGQG